MCKMMAILLGPQSVKLISLGSRCQQHCRWQLQAHFLEWKFGWNGIWWIILIYILMTNDMIDFNVLMYLKQQLWPSFMIHVFQDPKEFMVNKCVSVVPGPVILVEDELHQQEFIVCYYCRKHGYTKHKTSCSVHTLLYFIVVYYWSILPILFYHRVSMPVFHWHWGNYNGAIVHWRIWIQLTNTRETAQKIQVWIAI